MHWTPHNRSNCHYIYNRIPYYRYTSPTHWEWSLYMECLFPTCCFRRSEMSDHCIGLCSQYRRMPHIPFGRYWEQSRNCIGMCSCRRCMNSGHWRHRICDHMLRSDWCQSKCPCSHLSICRIPGCIQNHNCPPCIWDRHWQRPSYTGSCRFRSARRHPIGGNKCRRSRCILHRR